VHEDSFPPPQRALSVFLMIATQARLRWNLNVFSICISFIAKDAEHFVMYLLTTCTSSFENCIFNSFAHLLGELFILLLFNFWSSLYIMDINPLSDEQLAKIFFLFWRLSFYYYNYFSLM
jgi:hypothetical protein